MSYILDALRKADAERERGAVPGIHAQPHASARPAGTPAAARSVPPWVIWAVAGASALLFAAAAWVALSGGGRSGGELATVPPLTPGPPASTAVPVVRVAPTRAEALAHVSPGAAPVANVPAPAPEPSRAPMGTPPAAAPVAPAPIAPRNVAAAPSEPADAPALRKPRPPAQRGAAPRAETDAAGRPLAPPPAPRVAAKAESPPAAASAMAAAAPAASSANTRIYAAAELPDEIRRQLPTFVVGGSMYSPTPANRIVILGGQVFHEGDRVTPDLVVHQIKPKAAVLVFKGYRYEVAY